MTVVSDLVQTYSRPGEVFRKKLAAPEEARAFIYLITSCLLFFLGEFPSLVQLSAAPSSTVPLEARMSGYFLGIMILAPLVFYAFAVVGTLALRLLGHRVTWHQSRIVLFWSLLVVAPWTLVLGIARVVPSLHIAYVTMSWAVFLLFVCLWVFGLAQASRLSADSEIGFQ